jgi:hypothetical protein
MDKELKKQIKISDRRARVHQRETDRIAKRIMNALDGSYLKTGDEDHVNASEYRRLYWRIGRELVGCHLSANKLGLIRELASGMKDAAEEFGKFRSEVIPFSRTRKS